MIILHSCVCITVSNICMLHNDTKDQNLKQNTHIGKLQKRCDNRILFRISGRIDSSSYVPDFALESEYGEIHQSCADKNASAKSINMDILFKWKKREGSEATYQALLEIFEKANNEDLILKYAENGHSTHAVESMNLMFPTKMNNKDDIPELEKKYTKITEKVAFISEQSLKKTKQSNDLASVLP